MSTPHEEAGQGNKKPTQVELLDRMLRKRNYFHDTNREPYGVVPR